MGVYIKGMEIPKSCNLCPFEFSGDCLIDRDIICTYEPVTRSSDCPLVPVPPHGRLGDLDKQDVQIEALIERHLHGYTKSTWDFVCELRDILKRNRTIIEAEPSEEQRKYEAAVEAAQYCEMYEPTYDPETGAM